MSRDTDADWIRIAEVEPYFGVLANSEYLGENLDDSARERFFASGRGDIDHVVHTIRRHLDDAFQPRLAVDFGSGVGRLSIAMREHAARVIGIDVAPGMREIACAEVARRGLTDIEFAASAPSDGLDWVNSLIVFQHIPPERGYQLMADLARAVVPGGVLSIQITTHRDERHLHEVFRDVQLARFDGVEMKVLINRESADVGHMSMFDYDLGRIVANLGAWGFPQLWIEQTDHGGVFGAWIFARKSLSSGT